MSYVDDYEAGVAVVDVAETQLKEASPCRTNRALKKRQTVDPRS